jgi:hypothetical protein
MPSNFLAWVALALLALGPERNLTAALALLGPGVITLHPIQGGARKLVPRQVVMLALLGVAFDCIELLAWAAAIWPGTDEDDDRDAGGGRRRSSRRERSERARTG